MEDNELPNFDFGDPHNCIIPVFEGIFGTAYLQDLLEISGTQADYLFTPCDWFGRRYGILSTATKQEAIDHLKRFVFFDGDITKCSPTIQSA
jgi:hypothetical protein